MRGELLPAAVRTAPADMSADAHHLCAAGRAIQKQERVNKMTTVTYAIPAIHCGHCTHTIEMELHELAGVKDVKADLQGKKVEVSFEPPATEEKIKALLAEIKYPAEGLLAL